MRYLRRFNENSRNVISEIREVSIKDLEDLGFRVQYNTDPNSIKITKFGNYDNLSKKYQELFNRRFGEKQAKDILGKPSNLPFEWSEIKDVFLKYCKSIDDLFNISKIKVYYKYDSLQELKDAIDEDEISLDTDLDFVEIFIKGFNVLSEINELCDSYFAYLYDEGFSVNIHNGYDYLTISLGKNNQEFDYLDIRDNFIPFIKVVNSKYNLFKKLYFSVPNKSDVVLTKDEVLDDKVYGICKGIKFLIYLN